MKKFVTGLLAGGLLLAGSSVLAANDAETVNNEMKTEPVTAAAPSQAVLSKSRGTMVYVPMDTRPVCKDYTVATMQAAGWNIVVPPDELLSSLERDGQPDKLLEWLEQNAKEAVAVVASADALIYGGLVDSRTHHIEPSVLQSRAERLLSLKQKKHSPDIYVFVTIMRTPKASVAPAEPVYYEEWGSKLFRQGALLDKNETTELLLHGIESDSFNYLLVGRDDTSPLSQAHKEARYMSSLVNNFSNTKIRFFSGADQLGLVLLTQAANRLTYNTPLVYTEFGAGKGGATVPTYEDDTVAESAKQHIFAAGGFPSKNPDTADYILLVNTPYNGKTLEASDVKNSGVADKNTKAFADKVQTWLEQGKKVIVSDSAYGNGADNALVKELFRRGIAYDLAAYGGWNTSGNTLGFALSQGIESPYYEGNAAKDLLTVRYLDDWAYQANARMDVYKNVIWPNYMPNSGYTPEQKRIAEAAIKESITKVSEPVMGDVAKDYDFKLPWSRMFEVQPIKKAKPM